MSVPRNVTLVSRYKPPESQWAVAIGDDSNGSVRGGRRRLAVSLPDYFQSPLDKTVELLGGTVTLVGPPIELFGKLPVDRGKVNPVGQMGALTLFHRPRSIIVGIVRHGGKTRTVLIRSVCSPNLCIAERPARRRAKPA